MPASEPIPRTIRWSQGAIEIVDQRRLPDALEILRIDRVADLEAAIRGLAVRGAPVLGVAGAYGVALAARRGDEVEGAAARLRGARPTAVNLARGVDRALAAFATGGATEALACAEALAAEDAATNRALGAAGAVLLPPGARVLTHCNAGSLACVEYGTALGVIRAAVETGNDVTVWVDETRPVLQGARLTAWELGRLGIPYTLIVDAAAGSLFAAGRVDVVVVGADRIAANGDVANKVGTYPLAVLARVHAVPFFVAAPTSTIDPATPDGARVPIEDRGLDEVVGIAGVPIAPSDAVVHNPAFDITPAELVTAYVTERGVLRPPFPPPG